MKSIFKTILSLVAFFMPVSGLFAQIAPDVYTSDPNHPGFVYSKQPEGPNSKGEYTIYLKSFMTGTISESEKRIASEIVLVLDVSGSMRWDMDGTTHSTYDANSTKTRMYALKQAVNGFIDQVKTDAQNNSVDNKIAIVKFAGDRYYQNETANTSSATGNHKYYNGYWIGPNNSNFSSQNAENASEIVMGFTSVTSGQQDLKNAVNALVPGGCTAVDYGIYKARALMRTLFNNPTSDNPTPKAVTNKVIVVFTDGDPNHQSGFDPDVATTAISTMRPIKNWTAFDDPDTGASGKVKVYTIGTFGTDPDENTTARYMHRVSSNFPNATGMGENAGGSGGNSGAGYYILANSAQDLINAFGKISSDIATPAFVIKESASVVDVVAKSYAIPTGANASEVKVYTAPCTGYANGQYTFSRIISEWVEQDPVEIGLTVDKANGKITVDNFNFTDSDNIVASKTVGSTTTYRGNQLIIEIPIEMDESAVGGQNVKTNETGSGLRYIDENGVEQFITFISPDIHLPINLEIQKRGLNVGESAKFTIQRKWNGSGNPPTGMTAGQWYDYTSVFVTRRTESETGDNSPSVTIVGLDPNYLFRIKEEEWSWSYELSEVYGFNRVDGEDEPVKYEFEDVNDVTSDKVNTNPFIFVNTQKEDIDLIVRHAESIVTNEFRTATSNAKAGTTVNSKTQPTQ